MTWEETIKYIRTQKEYDELVRISYLGEDLVENVNRFRVSDEYIETKKLMLFFAPNAKTILDVGSGNGISSISFALDGFDVMASEPDRSATVGSDAIRELKNKFNIDNITIVDEFAEKINVENKFDVVYVRQAMHHAYDLRGFIKNLSGLLKSGGMLMTIRDHVIYNDADKKLFLEDHPLQKFYGGENAFTLHEYLTAFGQANLVVKKVIKHFESVINYFPMSTEVASNYSEHQNRIFKESLRRKIGALSNSNILLFLYKLKNNFNVKSELDESLVPGRMYSFITIKE